MTIALRRWFAERSLRERRLILVMLALAAVTLMYVLVILPVREGLSSSRTRYTDAVVRLGEAQAALAQVKATQRRAAPTLAGALTDAVRTSAEGAGLTLSTLEPDGVDRARAGIASARAGALSAWVAGLETGGVLVDTLTIAANGDSTVNAQLVLMRRGS